MGDHYSDILDVWYEDQDERVKTWRKGLGVSKKFEWKSYPDLQDETEKNNALDELFSAKGA